jgi:hypothetical protein
MIEARACADDAAEATCRMVDLGQGTPSARVGSFSSQRGGSDMSDIILFAHPTFGVLGILAAVWVLVEAMNATDANQRRLYLASLVVTVCILGAWMLGGFWYVNYYYAEKAVILKGPWPWAHNIFMETKEHLFFIPLILALYLPIVAAKNLARNKAARTMVMVVATFIVLNGLAIEGAGAIINYGAKVVFIHSGTKGSE